MKIGFVGMTHLGLNSAVAGAERGFDMVCYDPDAALKVLLGEHGLPPLLREAVARALQRSKELGA